VADLDRFRAHGIRDVDVYGPEDVPRADWAELNGAVTGLRLFAQTRLVGYALAGRFDGVYTYDVLVFSGREFARICGQARSVRLLCAPWSARGTTPATPSATRA
jgi:hypothetical protein